MNEIPFTSKVTVPKSEINITHQHPILLIGSCFAQNIGEKLLESKFNTNINPFGIIYNPISVLKSIHQVINKQLYSQNELIQFNDKWLSFNHHGSFSSFNKNKSLKKINSSILEAHQHLQKAATLFITFGSAWVYEYPKIGVVANCHKIPNKQFSKRLLSVNEITKSFNSVLEELLIINPKLEIVLTVSPVRHTKDGLHKNNLSKSTLLIATHDLVKQNKNCTYFPAYELIIDELRDYRFFKDDLVHPTEMAVNYVWEKFLEMYCNEDTSQLIASIYKIKQAVNHKPFNYKSEKHQKFIAQQLQLMDELSKQYPFLGFEEEQERIKGGRV